jgi:hypothetical protein
VRDATAILDLGPDLRRGTSTCQFEGAVLTDIEGSSRLWENAPTAMPEAIARQYEILDEVIARSVERGGRQRGGDVHARS